MHSGWCSVSVGRVSDDVLVSIGLREALDASGVFEKHVDACFKCLTLF